VGYFALYDVGLNFTEAWLGGGPKTYEGNAGHSTLVAFDGAIGANMRSSLGEVFYEASKGKLLRVLTLANLGSNMSCYAGAIHTRHSLHDARTGTTRDKVSFECGRVNIGLF
jgi:hypothetical protein